MEHWLDYLYSTFSMDERVELSRGDFDWPNYPKMTMDYLLNDPFESTLLNDFRRLYKICNPVDIRRIMMRACISRARSENKSLDLTVQEYEEMWSTYAE